MDTIKIYKDKTNLISDGGCTLIEIDNTYNSFIAGANRTYYGIKCNVRFTKDRYIVTSRKRDLSDIINQKIHISQHNLDYLQAIALQKNFHSRITSLLDFLKICQSYKKHAFIQISLPTGQLEISQLVNEINNCNMINSSTIIVPDLKYIKMIRALNLDIKLELLCKYYTDEYLSNAIKYHYNLAFNSKTLSKDLVDMCHDNYLKISVHRINNPIVARLLIECGVDYIYTSLLE